MEKLLQALKPSKLVSLLLNKVADTNTQITVNRYGLIITDLKTKKENYYNSQTMDKSSEFLNRL